MWLFKDVVILMNFFEPRIIKYLSNTLIWRKSLVESCWKGAHSFNSVIEIFALAIATGFQCFWFGQSICNCYFDRSCNSVTFSPHKINFGILAILIAYRIFMKHFSAFFGGLKYLTFLGKKRRRVSFSVSSCLLRGSLRASFCHNLFVWLDLSAGLLSNQYSILNTENQPKGHP